MPTLQEVKKRLAILNARQFGNDLERYIQPEIIQITKFHNWNNLNSTIDTDQAYVHFF